MSRSKQAVAILQEQLAELLLNVTLYGRGQYASNGHKALKSCTASEFDFTSAYQNLCDITSPDGLPGQRATHMDTARITPLEFFDKLVMELVPILPSITFPPASRTIPKTSKEFPQIKKHTHCTNESLLADLFYNVFAAQHSGKKGELTFYLTEWLSQTENERNSLEATIASLNCQKKELTLKAILIQSTQRSSSKLSIPSFGTKDEGMPCKKMSGSAADTDALALLKIKREIRSISRKIQVAQERLEQLTTPSRIIVECEDAINELYRLYRNTVEKSHQQAAQRELHRGELEAEGKKAKSPPGTRKENSMGKRSDSGSHLATPRMPLSLSVFNRTPKKSAADIASEAEKRKGVIMHDHLCNPLEITFV
jgi:hypothetical protein